MIEGNVSVSIDLLIGIAVGVVVVLLVVGAFIYWKFKDWSPLG